MILSFQADKSGAAPVAEWLRQLIISELNLLSSQRCGFEPSSGHVEQAKFCLWVVRWFFFQEDLPFSPNLSIDMAQIE